MIEHSVGVYIHVPFCDGKCPYCDFFSVAPESKLYDKYCSAVEREMGKYSGNPVDTVYFGGGTPTLLGADGLVRLLNSIKQTFDVEDGAEITFEMNPRTADLGMLCRLKEAGFNRVSMGVQSGVDSELSALGRRHTIADARQAVADVRAAGFDNLSLDLMLGVPGQTPESLIHSIEAVCTLDPEHISAYILKIEPGTPFAARKFGAELADDDGQAELYTLAVEQLARRGYERYEISNFTRPGRESRHNVRYWDCREYLGFGPSAHSFYGGRRFYYPRDLGAFMEQPETADDGEGGNEDEYVMLRLRLAEGLTQDGWRKRFGGDIPDEYYHRAAGLAKAGLLTADEDGIRLVGEGFLLSNAVIGRILGE